MRRPGRRFLFAAVGAGCVLLSATVSAAAFLYRAGLDMEPPHVESIQLYDVLFDRTPVTVTIAGSDGLATFTAPADAIRDDVTLWRRMHLDDWNALPDPIRAEALDRMMLWYRRELREPSTWDRMDAHDWDLVPQPVRTVAYRNMVAYWSGFYDVGAAHGLRPRIVSDTLSAIVMSESWFDHRAVRVNRRGDADFGLGQASAFARERLRTLHDLGAVDAVLRDDDYFNPWTATRFVAIWMTILLEETGGDLDLAVRAYHRGLVHAGDAAGTRYLEVVRQRLNRYIRNRAAPAAWDYIWRTSADTTS